MLQGLLLTFISSSSDPQHHTEVRKSLALLSAAALVSDGTPPHECSSMKDAATKEYFISFTPTPNSLPAAVLYLTPAAHRVSFEVIAARRSPEILPYLQRRWIP